MKKNLKIPLIPAGAFTTTIFINVSPFIASVFSLPLYENSCKRLLYFENIIFIRNLLKYFYLNCLLGQKRSDKYEFFVKHTKNLLTKAIFRDNIYVVLAL